jgi:hypothetical protein
VGDGRSHIFNYKTTQGGIELKDRDLQLHDAQTVRVEAVVCARLQPDVNETTRKIQSASPYNHPYWHLERARIDSSPKVPVELIMTGNL